jgi:predicted small lipoprotein YifL
MTKFLSCILIALSLAACGVRGDPVAQFDQTQSP